MGKVIIIMGVSGSGKSTIGKELATTLKIPFFDGDDFHPQNNIDKMSKGIPLDDDDRWPWLNAIRQAIISWQGEQGAVLACSALKESYRQRLSPEDDPVEWVYLHGDFDLILQRMRQRSGHYMGAEMLQSQFNVLEPPSYGIPIDISIEPTQIIKTITTQMHA